MQGRVSSEASSVLGVMTEALESNSYDSKCWSLGVWHPLPYGMVPGHCDCCGRLRVSSGLSCSCRWFFMSSWILAVEEVSLVRTLDCPS